VEEVHDYRGRPNLVAESEKVGSKALHLFREKKQRGITMYGGYEKLVRENKPIVHKRIEPKKHPCKGCEWGTYVSNEKVLCMLPKCVRGEKK
jgi:hypothetical protein